MKRIVSIAKEIGVTPSEIMLILKNRGYAGLTPGTKLSNELEESIKNRIRKNNSSAVMINSFDMESNDLMTVFTANIFSEFVQDVSYSGYNTVRSYFTDLQAKEICSRMSNNRIRYFSNLFLTEVGEINHLMLKYQIHFLAMKALGFYGGKILTFIYTLKKWPMGVNDGEVFKMKDVRDFSTNFPKITMESNQDDVKFVVVFTKEFERKIGNLSAVRISNSKTGTTAKVSIHGQLINNFEICMPEITLFKKCLIKGFQLYSGFDDGFCDICGRQLMDPISVMYGRGPECRKYNQF